MLCLIDLAASNAGDCWIFRLGATIGSFARWDAEAIEGIAFETIRATGARRVQRRRATLGTVHAAGCGATAEWRIGWAVAAKVRTVTAVSAVCRANAAGVAGGIAAADGGATFARTVGIAFRVVAQAAVITAAVVAVRVPAP